MGDLKSPHLILGVFMKIIINKTDKLEDVSDKVASRLINKGKAHYPEKQKVMPETKEEVIDIDLIEPIPERFTDFEESKEIQETVKKPKKLLDIPDEVFGIPESRKESFENKYSTPERQLDITEDSTRTVKDKTRKRRTYKRKKKSTGD